MKLLTLAVFAALLQVSSTSHATSLRIVHDDDAGTISIYRGAQKEPVLTQNARADFRPYLHPIVAPDGKGVLTEFSPGHHKHQTGIYWGFTRVNGRDYFHHPGGEYWRRVVAETIDTAGTRDSGKVRWRTVYDLIDAAGGGVMRETQTWTMEDVGSQYILDLEWKGEALTDVTIAKYDYGGLFIRMPWRKGMPAEVVNGARQRNGRAEGQRAVWLDVGMQVPGRDDMARIAIFDHAKNDGFPMPWRVDGQFGVGPARARLGDWVIKKGDSKTIRHQLRIYTGAVDDVELTKQWGRFSGQGGTWAQWGLAQREGRAAKFLTPQQAVDAMTHVDGFEVNVYAAEPTITQPMAFCWDDRGRMWIAENRDYESRGRGFANSGDSRILILEGPRPRWCHRCPQGVLRGHPVSRGHRSRHGWSLAGGATEFALRARS